MASGDHWTIYYSHYDPDKGGTNCAPPCGVTSSGALVAESWNIGAACPNELPQRRYLQDGTYIRGTIITLPGGEQVECIDRFNQTARTRMQSHPAYGHLISRIIPGTNAFWLDVLSKDAPVPYGTAIKVHVQFP